MFLLKFIGDFGVKIPKERTNIGSEKKKIRFFLIFFSKIFARIKKLSYLCNAKQQERCLKIQKWCGSSAG